MPPGDPPYPYVYPSHWVNPCYVHNGRGWCGVIPPTCTCGLESRTITLTWTNAQENLENRVKQLEQELEELKRKLK